MGGRARCCGNHAPAQFGREHSLLVRHTTHSMSIVHAPPNTATDTDVFSRLSAALAGATFASALVVAAAGRGPVPEAIAIVAYLGVVFLWGYTPAALGLRFCWCEAVMFGLPPLALFSDFGRIEVTLWSAALALGVLDSAQLGAVAGQRWRERPPVWSR